MDVRKWNPMCSKKVNINLSVKAANFPQMVATCLEFSYNIVKYVVWDRKKNKAVPKEDKRAKIR